ncbi:MAG: ATP-binding cassette domain-containing protein, partial [Phycisphaeraceae bacterium]|nr:ATP-binding cassette domain-containing protein [Phycisphaeraceae bacterium]
SLLRPYAGSVMWTVGVLSVLTLINMLIPAAVAVVFNRVFPTKSDPQGNWPLLWLILAGMVVIYVARNALFYTAKTTAVGVGEDVCFSLRNRMFEHLQQMKLRFYRENKAGHVSSRLMDDSFVIQGFIQDDMPSLMQAIFQFICLVAIVYAVNWQLALASTVVLPLHLVAFVYFKRPIKMASRVAAEQMSVVHGNLIEKFLGAEVVKSFTGEQRESEAFVRAIDQTRRSQVESKRFHVWQKVVADLLVGVGTVALLGFGAYQVLKPVDGMLPGTFIAFFAYVGLLYPTVLELMTGFAKLTKTTASVDRVFEMLESGMRETSLGGSSFKPIRGQIRFSDVWLGFGEDQPVLKGVNLEIAPGQVCAIVGASGAGKSTLVSLLPRFLEPDRGTVEVDGLDVRQIDVRHLRTHIGIAFQECFLFNSSILENLRYARPEATMKQIVEVTQRTGAHEFISKLADGYDTVVGEGGIGLSRGEKQRITLTRAMLKNPRILILDEATASIDVDSESQIMPAIFDFMQGKTTLMITHRPELLQHADLVVQIREGRVDYHGPAKEFLSRMSREAEAPAPLPLRPVPGDVPDVASKPHGESSSRGSSSSIASLGLILLLSMVLGLSGAGTARADDKPAGATPAAAAAAAPAPAPAAAPTPVPAPAPAGEFPGRLMAQGGLSDVQVEELLSVVVSRVRAELGYRPVKDDQTPAVAVAPKSVRGLVRLARPDYRGLHVVELGYQIGQGDMPAQVWIAGVVRPADKPQIDNAEVDTIVKLIASARGTVEGPAAANKDANPAAPAPVAPGAPGAPVAAGPQGPPSPVGQFMPMPDLSDIEAIDLLDVIVSRLQAEKGYSTSPLTSDRAAVPSLPEFRSERLLARATPEGILVIQLAYRTFRSQPLHVWLFGAMLPAGGGLPRANAEFPAVLALLADANKALETQAKTIRIDQLKTGLITLSYVEPDRCLGLLKTLGYQVIEYTLGAKGPGGQVQIVPTAKVDPATLPLILNMPGSDAVNLVGGSDPKTPVNIFGLTQTPSIPHDLPNLTSAAPMMQLMILYHPAHPEQFAQLLDRIRSTIDLPARQILIEAMVLEISQTGLSKLGLQWELKTSATGDTWRIGSLPTLAAGEQLTAEIQLKNLFGDFLAKIQALIKDGQAEILSRPSILTMDHRQASIRVGEEIPIATGATGVTSGDRLEFKFQYIPIGILLNVRPRVSDDGEQVSRQIDGIVSATIPGQELVMRDKTGQALASAPRISTRRVQTYSRVANNTPFIIGGLVSHDETKSTEKVPLLGDIPFLGKAFQNETSDRIKREVIIVITPYVLPENQVVGRNMPKDEDAFDSFGNRLFRDAYRIRAEDVFDLGFLTDNLGVTHLQQLADEAVSHNADLANTYPFDRFANKHVPGERILVYRQMYEVIKRRDIDDGVNLEKLIFFHPSAESQSGFNVRSLWKQLHEMVGATPTTSASPDKNPSSDAMFQKLRGKAVVMTWTVRRYDKSADQVLAQPVPQVTIIDCPDRSTWSRLLWDLNQPDNEGRPRFSLLIRDDHDLQRLQRAVVLKRTVEVNARQTPLTLHNFSVGRLLLMPTIKRSDVYLIDEETAMYFFFTELYYPALRQELTRDTESLKIMLKDPAIERLLGNPSTVDQPVPWQPMER